MKYIKIEPEAIVGMGENTVIDKSTHPPVISNLHLNLEDWLGDDLMENFPAFIVTEYLKVGLEESNFTGYEIKNLELTIDEGFQGNYKLSKDIPDFFWLDINGKKDIDDFYIDSNLSLNVSEKMLQFLNGYTLKYCIYENTEASKRVDEIFEEFERRKNNRT